MISLIVYLYDNNNIYTIKTQLKCIYVYMCIYTYIYVYVCRIEKTPRADFWHVGILLAWLGQVRVLEIFMHLTEL